jgi:hypothetical protein
VQKRFLLVMETCRIYNGIKAFLGERNSSSQAFVETNLATSTLKQLDICAESVVFFIEKP